MAYVDATGEIYSVGHGSPRDDSRVTVIAGVAPDALRSGLAGWHEMCDSDRPGSYGGSVLARSPQKNGVFASLNTRGCATPPSRFSPFPF